MKGTHSHFTVKPDSTAEGGVLQVQTGGVTSPIGGWRRGWKRWGPENGVWGDVQDRFSQAKAILDGTWPVTGLL